MIVLTTLGTAEILVEDAKLTPVGERAFATLLHLCLERGRPVRRTTLQAMIFPEGSASNGAHSLRQLLYKLRKRGAPIESTSSIVTLPPDAVRDDVSEILARGSLTAPEQAAIRTGFLAGYAPSFSKAYTEWLDQHRGSVSVRLRRVLIDQISRARTGHDWPALEDAARTCLALDSLNEEATFALSEAFVMLGSKAEAVALLDTYSGDVGPGARELRLSAAVLKRRISERLPTYSATAAADVPLVGRQPELGQLLSAFTLIREGKPRIVRLSGEAGIGKSRLVEEFERLATLEGARIVTVRAHPSDVHRPLSAFYDAVPRLLALPGALGCAPESMQFLKRFERLRTPTTTAIPDAERDAELLFANITMAIQDLLAAVALESTLLVIIEDAHWLDEHSTRLIEESLRSRESLALGMILTLRTDRSAVTKVESAPDLVSIDLGALDGPHCERLVELLLRAPSQTPVALRTWLAATAAGSPLYARLLVQHFESTGQAFEIPLSLSTLITMQLDELTPQARKVIETVTVLGRYATIERLRRLLGLAQFEFLLAVQELEDRRLLRRDSDGVRGAHALLEDSVVEKMQPVVAAVLHWDVATLLESEMSAETAHVPWDCALHWQRAGEPERAIAAIRMCARQALAVGQPGEACEVLERLGREQPAGSSLRRAICEELIDVAEATAEWRFIPDAVEQLLADDRSQRLKRPRDEYMILRFEALQQLSLGWPTQQADLRNILNDPAAEPGLRLRAATLIVERADVANDLADLESAHEVAIGLAPLAGKAIPELGFTYFELVYHTSFGDLDRVVSIARRLIDFSPQAPSPATRCRFLVNAGFAMWRAGAMDLAEATLLEAEAVAVQSRLPTKQLGALEHLCLVAILCDNRESARDYLRRAEALLATRGAPLPTSGYRWARAVLLIQDGRFDEAESWIDLSESSLPDIRAGKKRLSTEALRLLIRVGRGQAIARSEIEPVVADYEIAKKGTLDDMVVIGIATALAHCGEAERSASLATDYLAHRRRLRFPVPMALKALAISTTDSSS